MKIVTKSCLFHATRLLAITVFVLASQSVFGDFNPQATDTPRASFVGNSFLSAEDAFQLNASATDAELLLEWTIAPGYYLYKEKFKFMGGDTSTQLGAPSFPSGTNQWDDYFARNLEVFYTSAQIRIPLINAVRYITVDIESQGCADAGLCYPPQQQRLKIDLQSGITSVQAIPATSRPLAVTAANPNDQLSLSLTLIFAVIGGILLNLMPCVFPVLTIKAMSFVTTSGTSTTHRLHGISYAAGVILSFVAIALLMLILRAGGDAIGWGFQLQSPLFVSALIYLFFFMGLSLLGLFELGTGVMALGHETTQGSNYRASFMTGILATTVASPCTAPFMGPALGFTLTQPVAWSLLVFACLGLGMALPLILLTWIPAWRNKLPRPGAWMNHFKQAMAFPLFMTAVWLLWVVGKQTNMNVVASVVLGLVFLSLAIWLWKIQVNSARYLAKVPAIIVLGIALGLPLTMLTTKTEPRQWEAYSEAKLGALLNDNHAVFISVGADWCVTCLVNERVALSSESFYSALKEQKITYLKADWTRRDAEITAFLNRFQRTGVPLYVFYSRDNQEPQILDQILSSQKIQTTFYGKSQNTRK